RLHGRRPPGGLHLPVLDLHRRAHRCVVLVYARRRHRIRPRVGEPPRVGERAGPQGEDLAGRLRPFTTVNAPPAGTARPGASSCRRAPPSVPSVNRSQMGAPPACRAEGGRTARRGEASGAGEDSGGAPIVRPVRKVRSPDSPDGAGERTEGAPVLHPCCTAFRAPMLTRGK